MPSVCLSDPGYGVDVTIASDVRTLYRVWLGQLPLSSGLRHGLSIEGPRAVVRRIPDVLQLSPMAPLVSGALALHACGAAQSSSVSSRAVAQWPARRSASRSDCVACRAT